jgi:hypothetical protein
VTTTEHRNEPLFVLAEFCEHPEPAEPDSDWSRDDPAWRAHDEWHADHQTGSDGDRLCNLTEDGEACQACTEEADMPSGMYIKCQLTTAQESR